LWSPTATDWITFSLTKTLKSIPPTHTPAMVELFSEEYTGIAIPPDLKPEVILGIITFPK
jgi:hypothetical protein